MMKKVSAFLMIILMSALSSRAEWVEIATTNGTGGVSGQVDYDDGGMFGGPYYHVKNSGPTSGATRKGYIRFDTSGINFKVRHASFEITIHSIDVNIGGAYQVFHVYAVTNESLDNWSTSGVTWNNAPANDISSAYAADLAEAINLGTFTINYSSDKIARSGSRVRFTSQALVNVLNSDSNGRVTLIIGRTGTYDHLNLLFAGDTHTTYSPARLLVSDRTVPSVVNTGSYIDQVVTPGGETKIADISFDTGAEADKLIVQATSEGGTVSVITYNGKNLVAVPGLDSDRIRGVFYLDNPYAGGSATLHIEIPGTCNGLGVGIVSIKGSDRGYSAVSLDSSLSTTITTTKPGCFVVAGYGDQDDEADADAVRPLNQIYGSAIKSFKGAAGYDYSVPLGSNTYTFLGSGGIPQTCAVAFAPAPPSGMVLIIE